MSPTNTQQEILARIENKDATVAVIGLGYVGLPLALAFAESGFSVIGIDLNPDRVAAINRGQSYVEDVPSDLLARYTNQAHPYPQLRASTDYGLLDQVEAVIICVPTPLSKIKDPDMSYLVAATDEIAQRLRRGMLVVLESTTYPGTTEEILLPRLAQAQETSCQVGDDFFLAFSPERIDPGRTDYTIRTTPKVVGGITPACATVANRLYSQIIDEVVPVSSTDTAEMVKLLENTFRAVNIALVNEVALMCDRLGIDVWEVVEAAKTKPYGFMPFYPGPGLGGHCIPIDPHYLAWKLKTLDYNARFIQLAADINLGMPHFVATKVADALNEQEKAVKGSRILMLGVAYKANIGDLRESPALDIMRLLQAKGANLAYHDPYVLRIEEEEMSMPRVELSQAQLQQSDCVVIVTDHQQYDWAWVVAHSLVVVDSRNVTKNITNQQTRILKI